MLNLSFPLFTSPLSHSLYLYGFSLVLFSFSVSLSCSSSASPEPLIHVFTVLSKTSAYRKKKEQQQKKPPFSIIWNLEQKTTVFHKASSGHLPLQGGLLGRRTGLRRWEDRGDGREEGS